MSFFRSSENGEKSHRFVCRFFCRPKTGKKVIGLYVTHEDEHSTSKRKHSPTVFTLALVCRTL